MPLLFQIALLAAGMLSASGTVAFEGKVWSESLRTNRFIHIYLPPNYTGSTERYPVLYVHDGQNAFSTAGPNVAFGWGNWELDKTADRLIAEKKIRPIIIVAIDCGASRYREYRGPVPGALDNSAYQRYTRFLLDELKPKLDREYRTLKDAAHTGALGSSMGGICSLALAWEHPNVFGLAGSLSGAFQVEKRFLLEKVLGNYLGKPKPFRVYLDSGITDYSGGDDGAKLTTSVARELRRIGWQGIDLLHFIDQPLSAEQLLPFHLPPDKFAEAQRSQHNELYWRLRAWRALAFLFPPADERTGARGKSRAAILKAMQEVMGPLPGKAKRCPLDARIEEEVDCGDYLRRLVTYQSEPGARVPAYLLVPKALLKSREKAPAILCLHQTHNLGQKVVVGLGHSPNDEYAVELVRRGYVCFAPPYPLLADYAPDLKKLGYISGSMKAIWDNIRALDYLESLPFVKRGAFGAIGHSLGGHNSLFTAAFDPRIQVVVTSCGFDSFRDYMNGHITGWTSERYMPRLLDYPLDQLPFDFDGVLAAIAPRTVFISAPLGDTNFKYDSVDRIVSRVRRAFTSPDGTLNLVVEHPNTAHLFAPEIREEAYQTLDRILRPNQLHRPIQNGNPIEK